MGRRPVENPVSEWTQYRIPPDLDVKIRAYAERRSCTPTTAIGDLVKSAVGYVDDADAFDRLMRLYKSTPAYIPPGEVTAIVQTRERVDAAIAIARTYGLDWQDPTVLFGLVDRIGDAIPEVLRYDLDEAERAFIRTREIARIGSGEPDDDGP